MNNWSNHIGSLWAEQLRGKVQNGGTIVEVAPGGTNKIAIGLAKLNWSGRLFLVEPEALALQTSLNAYKELLPTSEIVPVKATLNQFKLDRFDALVANHPLDDMVAGCHLSAGQFADFFNDHYTKEVDLTKNLWNSMKVADVQRYVRATINEMVEASRRATSTIISQYDSYFFTSNGFTKPDDVAFEALKSICSNLNGKLIRNNRWLIA